MYQILTQLKNGEKAGAVIYELLVVIDAHYIKQSSGKKVTHKSEWVMRLILRSCKSLSNLLLKERKQKSWNSVLMS